MRTRLAVAITGTIEKPEIKLTSEPAMDEGQIALLIATGRLDFKAGAGGVQNTVEQASNAAFSVLHDTGEFPVLPEALRLHVAAVGPRVAVRDAGKVSLGVSAAERIWIRTAKNNSHPTSVT